MATLHFTCFIVQNVSGPSPHAVLHTEFVADLEKKEKRLYNVGVLECDEFL